MQAQDSNFTDLNQPMNQAKGQVPKGIAAFVLGICSMAFAFAYGIFGLVCAIIGMIFAGQAKKAMEENPDAYSEGSMKLAKLGRTFSIIGLILSSIMTIVFMIIFIAAFA